MAMRPESFNLPTFPTPGLPLLVCYFRLFLSSLHQPTGFSPKTNALLVQSARHMCVQRRAIPMLGRLKDYLLRAKIMFSRELPAHHFYRCRFFSPRRCFKSGDIHETNYFCVDFDVMKGGKMEGRWAPFFWLYPHCKIYAGMMG